MKRLNVLPVPESLPEVTAFVEDILNSAEVPVKAVMQILIAIDEIYANIVSYSKASLSFVDCGVENGVVTVVFTDDGIPYDPTSKPDPDITLPLEERQIGGLGIYMVKKSMDSVEYKYSDKRNILVLVKKLK